MRRKLFIFTGIVFVFIIGCVSVVLVKNAWYLDDNSEKNVIYKMPRNWQKGAVRSGIPKTVSETVITPDVDSSASGSVGEEMVAHSSELSAFFAEMDDLKRQAENAMLRYNESKEAQDGRAAEIAALEREISEGDAIIADNYAELRSMGYEDLSSAEIDDRLLSALLDYQALRPDLENASYDEVLEALKADRARLLGR